MRIKRILLRFLGFKVPCSCEYFRSILPLLLDDHAYVDGICPECKRPLSDGVKEVRA